MIDVPKILASLKDQLGCYRKLQKLCELQRQYVQQNQTDELIATLEARAQLLGEIGRLEGEVAPLKRGWAEVSGTLNEPDRESAATMFAEAKSLLEQITRSDQDDVLLLQQRKLNVGRQIQATQSARKINHRYATAAYGSGPSKLNIQK